MGEWRKQPANIATDAQGPDQASVESDSLTDGQSSEVRSIGLSRASALHSQPDLGAGPDISAHRVSFICAALTCALTPAYTVRWRIGFYPTTLLEISLVVTVAVFLVETLRSREPVQWRTPFTWPAVLLLVAGALAVLVAPDHRAALGLFRAYLAEPIAFFFVLAQAVTSWRRASAILLAFATAGLGVAVPNLFVVLDAIRHHTLNSGLAAPAAIYNTPNAVALFLVPLIAVAAAIVVYARDRRERLAAAAFLLIAGPACLLSFSRGGYLGLVAVAVGLAISHRRRLWLLGATVVAVLAVSRIPPVASRLGHEVDFNDPNNSLLERTRLWTATLRMLRDHPLFGGGLSGFKQAIAPYGVRQSTAEDVIYPHNILLNAWTETGILGVIAFGWLLVQAVRVSITGWRSAEPVWRPLYLGVLLAIAGVLVHGLVDVPYWKNDLSVEFWALLALTWAGLRGRLVAHA